MSVVREATVGASPREIIEAVHASIGRTEDVFLDIRQTGGRSVGIVVYEQYFSRVGNRIVLAVMADDFAGDGSSLVRVIVSGSSKGMVFNFDLGAAGDYASEAMGIISRLGDFAEENARRP